MRFDRDTLSFPVHLKHNSKSIKTCRFSAPFQKFDYARKDELDTFLQQYPDSAFAPAIFRMRFECCRRAKEAALKAIDTLPESAKEQKLVEVINEYNAFIEKYSDRLLTRVAIHEVFGLYTKVNRISFYHNFIQRYPDTEHSLVAKEHTKALLFGLCCTVNSVDAYEKFLEFYPGKSIYRDKCLALATRKAVEDERKYAQSLGNASDAKNRRANLLVQQLLQVRKEYSNLPLQDRIHKALSDTRISRIKEVIVQVYPDTFAINTILILENIKDIIELNQAVINLLNQQHQETIRSLNQHFETLNRNLEENFKAVRKDITEVNANINSLRDDLKTMHSDIQQRFDKVDAKLEQIDTRLQEGFALVNSKLDTGFAQIGK